MNSIRRRLVTKKIIGIFKTEDLAIRAIEGLRSSGYRDDEISIITKDEEKYNALTNKVGKDVTNEKDAAGGAAAGAVTGGTIGGFGGLLLGLGALAIPGVGPIVAAGPIAAAITGALAGGAVGGLAGALIDYGVPEIEAKEYEERINAGDILILVDDDEQKRDEAYDHFYRNESLNRDTYRHRDRSAPYEDDSISEETGKPSYLTDSYAEKNEEVIVEVDKNKDLDKILEKNDEEVNENPAYDGGIATHDKGWNKEINKDPEKGNTNHIVDGHERQLEEDEPFEADKPYELDKKLRDVDQF